MALSLGRAVAKTPIRAAQLNQLIDFLEGASSENIAMLMRAASGSDIKFVLADAAGARSFKLLDSAEATIFEVNSNGDVTLYGSLATDPLIVPGEAVPAQTTAGSLRRDTDEHFLTIGTGSGTKRLGLVVGASAAPALTGEMAFDTTTSAFKVHDGTSARQINPLYKRATATQTVSASTTFVDVVAAGSPATMSVAVAANEVWEIEWELLLTFTSTGGFKCQITGPAAPTSVYSDVYAHRADATDTGALGIPGIWGNVTDASLGTSKTAFSTTMGAANAGAQGSVSYWINNISTIRTVVRLKVTNGANAGTITLQIAQNSAAGTTVVGVGSRMRAERLA